MTASENLTAALVDIRAHIAGGGTLNLNFNVGRPEGWPGQNPNDVPVQRNYWQDNELELE
jgi:hypothetical protein